MTDKKELTHKRRHRKWWIVLAFIIVIGAAGACLTIHYAHWIVVALGMANTTRENVPGSENWAQPLEIEGVGNFHKVSQDLYRGAQPTSEGMKNLEKMGIKTVFNLRSLHSDRDELSGTNLGYEHLTMKTWHPEHREFIHFLKVLSDPNKTPVFVHCQRGSDRTGTMCAAYRVVIQGWTKQQALDEMTRGGFGFYPGWDDLTTYIENLDTEAVKKEAGLLP